MYKLILDKVTGQNLVVKRLSDNTFIPTNPDNTDYQTFKKEVLVGAELQDADGNVMTDAKDYVRTLP
jgi:hypothetical protein